MLYICVGFRLLAHETCDLSQAEKKTAVTSWAIAQNDNYFIHSFWVKIVVMKNRWTPNFWSEKLKNYNQSPLKLSNESRILLTFLKKQMTVKESHLVKLFKNVTKICLSFAFLQIHWPSYTHSLSIRNALSRNYPLILDFFRNKDPLN